MARSQQLLAEYVETGSEAAFRALVDTYIGLVFGAARRLVGGDTHKAQEVAQIVFSDLARKAGALSRESMLGGWLHRHTCYVASTLMRTERRRHVREKIAIEMNDLNKDPDPSLAQLAPVLDEIMNELQAPDRELILQRFFQQQDFGTLGEALGITEDAARMRVNRALEKLHELLRARGLTLSAATLGAVLASEALTAAPTALIGTIAAAAVAGATGTGGVAAVIVKAMSLTNSKLAIAAALVATVVAVPAVLQYSSYAKALRENSSLRQQLASAETSLLENQRLSNLVAELSAQASRDKDQVRELLKLRGEVARLRNDRQELTKLRQSQAAASQVEQDTPTNRVPTLYTRLYKVDPAVLLPGFSSTDGITTGLQPSYQAAVQKLLKDHDITIEAPAAVFVNVTNGTLLVRSSLQDLDKVERLVATLPLPDSKSGP